MSYVLKSVAVTILILAAQVCPASELTEASIKASSWGKDVLILRRSDDSTVQLLMAVGPYPGCGITTQGGGVAVVEREGSPKKYGCWQSLENEQDGSVWIFAQLSDGTELKEPLSSFRKKPYESAVIGVSDLWSEENYQSLGKSLSENILQVQHRIKVVTALAPSFDEKEKADAVGCLSDASSKLQRYLKVSELIVAEHEKQAIKWSSRDALDAHDLEEKRRDMRVVIDMAGPLSLRMYQLDGELQQCLRSNRVPLQ